MNLPHFNGRPLSLDDQPSEILAKALADFFIFTKIIEGKRNGFDCGKAPLAGLRAERRMRVGTETLLTYYNY